jgi:hypothetical protein
MFDALMTGARKVGLVGPETPQQQQQRQNFARDFRAPMQEAKRQRPRAFGAGEITAAVAGTAPIGGVIAAPVKLAARVAPALAPVATALGSAGMATGVKTAKPVMKAVDALLRVTAGGTVGGVSSAALNQAIDEGTAVGAAFSLVPLVGRYGVGPAWDALRGRVGDARAAKIFRQALGANLDAAREAFTKGGKGTASQVLSRIGIDADTFFATGNLVAKSGSGTGVLDDIARGQAAAQAQVMDAAAGATTRTGSRQAAEAQRAGTTAQAVPIMDETLGAVNTNTRNAMVAQQEAGAARQVAATETDAARRLLAANDRSANLIRESGLRLPADIKRQREIVGGLERFGGEAAERSLQAGEAARTAEQRLADMQAAGVQPLNSNALSGRLRQMADVERANPEKSSVLRGFADQIDDLSAQNGGIIDARDLYELRKDAGGIVDRLLQGRTPDAIRKRTAEVVGAFRPLVDDAIEAAGGARWKEYFKTFSTGMDEARRIELSDFARKLAVKQPEQFQALMSGDRTDIVERFFGKGRFDINEALGPKALELQEPLRPGATRPTVTPSGPSRMPAMQEVAQDIGADLRIKNNLTSGAQARAANVMAPPLNPFTEVLNELPFSLGRPVARPLELIEQRFVGPNAMRALERGFASPQGATNLLDYVPTGQQGINFLEGLSPDTLRMLQQFGVQTGRERNPNALRR